jgi:hypothetical protein
MRDENSLRDKETNKEHKDEISRIWEGRLGRRRFRLQWDRRPGAARLRFQAPFAEDDDPDGVGTPFAPDLGFVWERGRSAHMFGRYTERLGKLQQEAPAALDRVISDLEAALETMREGLKKPVQPAKGPKSAKGSNRSPSQRVRVEYEESAHPFDKDLTASTEEQAGLYWIANEEREKRRRAILESFRAGTISLEETEQQLNELS